MNEEISRLKRLLREKDEEIERVRAEFKKLRNEWETRVQYSRRGLEVSYRELAKSTAKLRKAHRELRELKEELEKKVIERTADLEARTKEAEEERNKTQIIIANFADGLLVFDSLQRLSLINPRAQELLEIREKAVNGKTLSELRQFPHFGVLADVVEEHCARKEIVLRQDLTLEVTVVSTAKDKETGVSVMLLVVLHDITEEKEFEGIKTDFASLVAHELRTPITSTKGYLDSVLEGRLGSLNKEQKLYLQRAFQANERQLEIIESLLAISKIETRKMKLLPSEFSIVRLAKEVTAAFFDKASKKGLKLEVLESEAKIPKIFADRGCVYEVLNNFLSNAIRFTQEGNVTVSFEKTEEEAVVAVSDTGVGIPAEAINKLFTKFYRVGQATTEESEGTGLGLYIAKSMVELHKGRVWVESEVGRGSTFYFSLPFRG